MLVVSIGQFFGVDFFFIETSHVRTGNGRKQVPSISNTPAFPTTLGGVKYLAPGSTLLRGSCSLSPSGSGTAEWMQNGRVVAEKPNDNSPVWAPNVNRTGPVANWLIAE